MKKTFVFRIAGEICCVYSVLSAFDAMQRFRLPMALFALSCLLLGFLIVACKSGALRLLLSLLPMLCFLLGPLEPLALLPGAVGIYYAVVMTQGHYAYPLDEYRRSYTVLLVICLFFVAANIANSTIYRGHLISTDSLIYVFLFLCFGVITMRRMQMGAAMSLRWHWSNALAVIGLPLACVGVSVLVFLLLRYSEPAIRLLFYPLGRFLIWLIHKLFPDGSPVEEMPLKEYLRPATVKQAEELPIDTTSSRLEPERVSEVFNQQLVETATMIGAYVFLGVLLLLSLALILQHIRKNQKLEEAEELYYEPTEEAAPGKKKRRGRGAPPLSKARQLRRIYQTYLEYLNANGLRIEKSDTSQEILDRGRKVTESPEAVRLRQLYIAARYGDPAAVTEGQVREAEQCLEAIVKEK